MYQNKLEEKLLNKADTSGVALIVGSKIYQGKPDRRKLYPEAIGVDMQAGDGVDVVADMIWRSPASTSVTHIDCVSVLEHCKEPWEMLRTFASYARGTTVFITVPFTWREHAYPDDYYRFTKNGLIELCDQAGIEIETAFYVSGGKKVSKPPVIEHDGVPYFGRTEVYAFGRVR